MNREIKFKVWDNWNKKFLNYGEVDIWDLIFQEQKLMEEIYTDGMANECLEFLQYTGLKDNNGKEIYEGDIVLGRFILDDVEDYIYLSLTDMERKNQSKTFLIKDISYLYTNPIPEDIEVIGNVFENPELLNKNNMSNYIEEKLSYNPNFAVHPGESLKNEMEFLHLSQVELSQRTGLSEKCISQIVNGVAPITSDTAIKLELALGTPAVFWNNLQKNYDLNMACIALEKELQTNKRIKYMNIEEMLNKVICGDCLEVMKDIPDKSIDMILCDLPYAETGNKWDFPIDPYYLWMEYERIIKDEGAIVLTGTFKFGTQLYKQAPHLYKYDWIWEKDNGTNAPNVGLQPFRIHEQVFVFSKGRVTNGTRVAMKYNPQKTKGEPYKQMSGKMSENWKGGLKNIETNNETGDRHPKTIQKFTRDKTGITPNPKPVALFEYLIKTYTNEEDIVLDNCAGSGTTGVACKNLNRNYILIEKEPKYIDIINKRLNALNQERLL